MDDPLDTRLGALSPEERGLLAALQLLGAGAGALAAVRASEPCRQALAALQGLPRQRRAEVLADLLKEVAAPFPARLQEVHPSWIEAAVAGEVPGLVRAVLAGLPVPFRLEGEAALRRRGAPPSEAWTAGADLQRIVLAPLVALTVDPAGPLGARLAALPPGELEAELARQGARTLGQSLAGAPLPVRAQAMARAGAPWSEAIGAAAAETTDDAAREQARSVVARAAAVTGEVAEPERRLRVVGALVLGRALAEEGPASAARVAGRLPIDLGRVILAAPNKSAARVF